MTIFLKKRAAAPVEWLYVLVGFGMFAMCNEGENSKYYEYE